MKERKVKRIGQIYADAKPPRRQWRIVRQRGDSFTLERTDKTTVLRFVDADALTDTTRYLRIS